MQVRAASIQDRDYLIALTFRSKAHWGYDAAFMENVREELKVPVVHIEAGYVHVLEDATIIGFFSLIEGKEKWELDFAFLDSPYIGKGYGRALWEAILEQAKSRGIASFTITADPNAEGFICTWGRNGLERYPQAPLKTAGSRFCALLCGNTNIPGKRPGIMHNTRRTFGAGSKRIARVCGFE